MLATTLFGDAGVRCDLTGAAHPALPGTGRLRKRETKLIGLARARADEQAAHLRRAGLGLDEGPVAAQLAVGPRQGVAIVKAAALTASGFRARGLASRRLSTTSTAPSCRVTFVISRSSRFSPYFGFAESPCFSTWKAARQSASPVTVTR